MPSKEQGMFARYLADRDVIGSTVIEAADGDLLLMYSSADGKHFLKSSDHFRCSILPRKRP